MVADFVDLFLGGLDGCAASAGVVDAVGNCRRKGRVTWSDGGSKLDLTAVQLTSGTGSASFAPFGALARGARADIAEESTIQRN